MALVRIGLSVLYRLAGIARKPTERNSPDPYNTSRPDDQAACFRLTQCLNPLHAENRKSERYESVENPLPEARPRPHILPDSKSRSDVDNFGPGAI
jgi:hypothetical protein